MAKINSDIIETCHDYGIILDSREIFLHGRDGEDSNVDYKMAVNFIKNLKILERSPEIITIHQYSIGGDWCSGMAMYDAIINSPCNFIFICYGIAASMGSIIPQAVKNKGLIVTHKNCDWVIHEGYVGLDWMIPNQAKSNMDYFDSVKKTLYDIYLDSCVSGEFFKDYNRSKIKAYLKRKMNEKTDWCLTGNEAVYYGFADAVLGSDGYEDIKTIKTYL